MRNKSDVGDFCKVEFDEEYYRIQKELQAKKKNPTTKKKVKPAKKKK